MMTFNEKIRERMLSTDQLLSDTADKIKVRHYIDSVMGENNLLDFRIYEGYSVDDALSCLKKGTVLKPNNGSGKHIFMWGDPDDSSIASARSAITDWMCPEYPVNHNYERFYRSIKPGIVVESMLYDTDHVCYRFYTFKGVIHHILAHSIAFKGDSTGISTKSFTAYTPSWNKINVWMDHPVRFPNPDLPAPESLEEMTRIASILGQAFSFTRVDLFEWNGSVRFSELTHTPTAGVRSYNDPHFEQSMSDLWI